MSVKRKLSQTFREFFDSKKSGGVLLIACTAVPLAVANSAYGPGYLGLWHAAADPLSVEYGVNDGLMAVFLLLIGLELEREMYVGELSDFRNALLPIVAAAGGILVPAAIHLGLNAGTPTRAGVGIIAGLLGGIGFTMSIFITDLAFPGEPEVVNAARTAILVASLAAGALGFLWLKRLKLFGRPQPGDQDMDAMDFAD